MEIAEARERYAALKEKIDYHNHLYYDLDAPELDDYAYDALTRELKALEAEHPEFVNESSPTQHVGGVASGRFEKVTHIVKMESCRMFFHWMKSGNSTRECGKPVWRRSMWWRQR